MKLTAIKGRSSGFALPTILIASVVMITVLVAAASASASVRVALNSQYYNQLAREAAESGLARAKECLASNGYVAQWSTKDLYPNTSCSGGDPCTNTDTCFVLSRPTIRTTFDVSPPVNQDVSQLVQVKGRVELLRSSTKDVWKVYDYSLSARVGIDLTLNSVVFGYIGGTGAYFGTIAEDGSISAVGNNNYGQLGNGTMTATLTPQHYQLPGSERAAGIYTNFLSNGWDMFVVTTSGNVYGAGNNNYLQLGNPAYTATNVATPIQFQVPGGRKARYVASVGYTNFVVTTDNNVYAVGYCGYGLLGYNYTESGCTAPTSPVRVALPTPVGTDLNTLPTDNFVIDRYTAFVRMQGGRVYGWGAGDFGNLANGTYNNSTFPVKIGTFGDSGQPKAVQVVNDGASAWILGDDGKVYGTGWNGKGQLGNGDTTNQYYNTLTQMTFPDPSIKIKKIATDMYSLIAMTDTGDVWGAGENQNGELGIGTNADINATPQKMILPAGVKAVDIYNTATVGYSSDYNDTFIIGSDGNVYGCGANTFGQIGNGTSGSNVLTPVKMNLPAGVQATQVQAGYGTTIVLTSDKKIYTVGNNSDGQLGDGTTTSSSTPKANRYTNALPITNF